MKEYFLIARKQVVHDIAKGIQKTEERDDTEYYRAKFKDFDLPCRFKLRGGYNKVADYVVVEVVDIEFIDYENEKGEVEHQTFLFKLGNVIETSVK